MKSLPLVPRGLLQSVWEQVQGSLIFERSHVNPRNEKETSVRSELARCEATGMIHAARGAV